MPILDELGIEYAGSRDVMVAKIDATEQTSSDFEIDIFPTIRLYLNGGNEVLILLCNQLDLHIKPHSYVANNSNTA